MIEEDSVRKLLVLWSCVRFQTDSVARNAVRKSRAMTGAVIKHPSFHPSSTPPNRSILLLLLQQQKQVLVLVRPVTTLGLRKSGEANNLKWAPRGPRPISVKRRRRKCGGGGSADPDVFEEWLRANPLPDVSLMKGKQNADRALDDLREGRARKEEWSARDSSTADNRGIQAGYDQFRTRNAADKNNGDPGEMANGIFLRGQESTALKELESPGYKVDDLNIRQGLAARVGESRVSCTGQNSRDRKQETYCTSACASVMRWCGTASRGDFWRYLQSLQQRKECQRNKQLLALLSSSAAALGIFEGGTLLLHKMIIAYTVRAKQGKSQLTYLRQGGPGRMTVRGAIRAREGDRFFARVCAKLNEWGSEIEDCEVLFFSGTTRVLNEVYAEDGRKMPVRRNDSRWCKVPYSVPEPRFREVQRVFYGLSHGAFGYTSGDEQRPPP